MAFHFKPFWFIHLPIKTEAPTWLLSQVCGVWTMSLSLSLFHSLSLTLLSLARPFSHWLSPSIPPFLPSSLSLSVRGLAGAGSRCCLGGAVRIPWSLWDNASSVAGRAILRLKYPRCHFPSQHLPPEVCVCLCVCVRARTPWLDTVRLAK